jgi:hypothetical protein
MPDPAFIVAVIGVVFAGICAIAAVTSLIIQHRSTQRLPEAPSRLPARPSSVSICTAMSTIFPASRDHRLNFVDAPRACATLDP